MPIGVNEQVAVFSRTVSERILRAVRRVEGFRMTGPGVTFHKGEDSMSAHVAVPPAVGLPPRPAVVKTIDYNFYGMRFYGPAIQLTSMSWSGGTVTLVIPTPATPAISAGDRISIAGESNDAYNGAFSIATATVDTPSAGETTITFALTDNPGGSSADGVIHIESDEPLITVPKGFFLQHRLSHYSSLDSFTSVNFQTATVVPTGEDPETWKVTPTVFSGVEFLVAKNPIGSIGGVRSDYMIVGMEPHWAVEPE